MLLRRLSGHVRDQNWFAVALDLGIVVLGVFIGLQVQQWAERRAQLQTEAVYVARLHDEVVALRDLRAPLVNLRASTARDLASAVDSLFGASFRPLTETECRSIAFAYFSTNPTDDLASLVELQTSVRLSSFRDERVLEALKSFLLTRTRARDANAGILQSARVLALEYPQMVRVVTPTRTLGGQVPGIFACDAEAMRASTPFLNSVDFAHTQLSLHVAANEQVSDRLRNLHAVLDESLGITHLP